MIYSEEDVNFEWFHPPDQPFMCRWWKTPRVDGWRKIQFMYTTFETYFKYGNYTTRLSSLRRKQAVCTYQEWFCEFSSITWKLGGVEKWCHRRRSGNIRVSRTTLLARQRILEIGLKPLKLIKNFFPRKSEKDPFHLSPSTATCWSSCYRKAKEFIFGVKWWNFPTLRASTQNDADRLNAPRSVNVLSVF